MPREDVGNGGSGVAEQAIRTAFVYWVTADLSPLENVQIIQVDFMKREVPFPDLCHLSIYLNGFRDIDIFYLAAGTNGCTQR